MKPLNEQIITLRPHLIIELTKTDRHIKRNINQIRHIIHMNIFFFAKLIHRK